MTPGSVKRYSQHGYDLIMEQDPKGEYVKFEDFELLRKRNRELVAALKGAEEVLMKFNERTDDSRASFLIGKIMFENMGKLTAVSEALKEPESWN